MTETRQFKLVSRLGTLLGVVTIPAHWAEELDQRGYVRILRAVSLTAAVRMALTPQTCDELSTADLVKSYHDAVELYNCSIEDFEKISECSFAPSAGYFRSMIEGTQQ